MRGKIKPAAAGTGDAATPMMAQYQQIKSEHPDSLLFYRLGDFYELFGDDAKEASRLLEITLTARSSGEGRTTKIPMCGVPHHAAEGYIQRLLKAGRKVAIVEQMEDPRKARGMVRRELVRIITPGTVLSPESLEAKQNNYLLACMGQELGAGLAAADLSTGEFVITEFEGPQAWDECFIEIGRLQPAEILVPEDISPFIRKRLSSDSAAHVTQREGYRFDPDAGRVLLLDLFKVASLDGFGCAGMHLAIGAAAAVVHYLSETQRTALAHIRKITPYSVFSNMRLDDATIRNLELLRNLADGTRKNTLLEVLDHTLTAMGGRKLRQWILRPLLSLESIQQRQDMVAECVESPGLRQKLGEILGVMHDLERLAGRVGAGTSHPRDLAALRDTLTRLPELKKALQTQKTGLLFEMAAGLPECHEVRQLLHHALADHPPVTIKEGGIIRKGFDRQVDELRVLTTEGKNTIARLQAQEREKTGIQSLKVEYNSVFGYYIEVSKANARLVPEYYQRKQTLVNAERYITPELKEYEQKVLGAEEKLKELEESLFLRIRSQVAEQLQDILLAADMVAGLDAVLSLAAAAVAYGYVRPRVDMGDVIDIRDGRHPVVERLTAEKFIPNDTRLDKEESKILIITGPNMAGKSTYLRQTALLVIMSQIGGYVPAREARIGVVDRVFTRVGAADNLAGGQSTFMVEMNETANILNNATPRSLVILDEVGRGTSTFDGVSIAWAVAEHLHDRVDAKTMFATHYYELTELALSKALVKNYNIAVREWKEDIIFLRKIVEGSADRSYGIQVARLAGLPLAVIQRAREVLVNLERANYTENGSSRLAEHDAGGATCRAVQENLFTQRVEAEIYDALRKLSPDQMTPLEALHLINEWKQKSLPETKE
ncbi:DNA mismatch repair protein MutS [candidate division FCPU426 bacterium]|nr:DNA mismatch repair protein MutS [candidate division FCPU426 bacterium]